MKILSVKNRIMLGVYFMFLLYRLRSPFMVEIFALAVLGGALSLFVSIPSVLSNMAESPNVGSYLVTAFSNAEALVQSLIVLAFATVVFSLRNFGNMLRSGHLSRRRLA